MQLTHAKTRSLVLASAVCGAIALPYLGAGNAYAEPQTDLQAAAAELDSLGGQLNALKADLADAQELLAAAESATVAKDAEVEAVRNDLEAKRDALSKSVKVDYKIGIASYIDYLVSSENLEELMARVQYADRINRHRSNMIKDVQDAQKRLEYEREQLEITQSAQKAQVDELYDLIGDYQARVDEAADIYNALDAQAKEALAEQAGDNVSVAVDAVENSKGDFDGELHVDDILGSDSSGSDKTQGGSSSKPQEGKPGGSGSKPVDPNLDNDPSQYPGGSDNVNRGRDARLGTVTWSGDTGYLDGMVRLANKHGSATNWFLTFDNELLRFCALQRTGSGWKVVKTWNCIGAQNTYSGKWSVLHKRESNWYSETTDWFQNGNGPNAWSTDYIWGIRPNWSKNHERWVDSPYGSGYEDCAAIHGAGTDPGRRLDKSNRGCCGLLNSNAKWVYDTIPTGSTVYEFEYSRVGIF